MALPSGSSRILCDGASVRVPVSFPFVNQSSVSWRRCFGTTPFTVSASPKKPSSSSRTGKFDSKNRRTTSVTTKEQEDVVDDAQLDGIVEDGTISAVDDGFVMPELPGEKPDFWEGPQWDAFGFFVQYMWAFGVVFALIACGIAVASYNEGATDFKETPAYKESIQSQELLEGPDVSNSDVFESNPTEEAPSLE